LTLVAGTVRDLIEAGLSELADAVVVMGFFVAGWVPNSSAQGVSRRVQPRLAAPNILRRVALCLLEGFVLHDAYPDGG
jgi:hypothetical protein